MKKVKNINSLPKADFSFSSSKKNRQKRSEFQDMLEAYMLDTAEELETYPLQLPKHGAFWDDGYRDIRLVNQGG